MTAFIFDLDGTLADSVPFISKNMHKTLEALGIDAKDEDIRTYIGIPLVSTGEHFMGRGRGDEFIAAYNANCAASQYDFQGFSGIKEMLAELQDNGAKLAVATSKLEKPAYNTLKAIGLLPYFSVVVHCEMGCGYKPSPGPALRAIAELGSAPDASWFIGDSIHDVACGKSAHIHAVGVTWGANTKAQLEALHPDAICDSVPELHALLLKILRENG
jgi:phosphoglycolate phosphatase-like HAD superfamily hydrolase